MNIACTLWQQVVYLHILVFTCIEILFIGLLIPHTDSIDQTVIKQTSPKILVASSRSLGIKWNV